MHFEAALNLVWLSLGVLAFAGAIHNTFRDSTGAEQRHRRWLHIVGVGLIVAALFPYISASDDILRVEHFNAQHQNGHSGKHSQNDDLIRLYETMDSPLVCRVCEIALTFCFISLIVTPVARQIDRIAPSEAGRSPPVIANADLACA